MQAISVVWKLGNGHPSLEGARSGAPAHLALILSSGSGGRILVHGKSRVKLALFGEGRGGVGCGWTGVQGHLNPEHH
jgi:hypothetical protein